MIDDVASATDEALAAEIAASPDNRLCTELFRRYGKKIYLWSFSYTHEVEEAIDISRGIVDEIFRDIRSFSGRLRFSTWAYRVTRDRCLGELAKRRMRWRDRLLSIEENAGAETLEAEVFARVDAIGDLDRILGAAREGLSADELEALVLHYREGLTLSEIAKVVGCANATGVRILLQSAKTKFSRPAGEGAFEKPFREHIDLETLEKHLLGKLDERETEIALRHIKQCALCGLELKRLQRFSAIDSDDDLSRSAEWIYARRRLENDFSGRSARSVASAAGARRTRLSRVASASRWIVPLAIMAGGLVVIAHFSNRGEFRPPEPARRVAREIPAVRHGIELVEPAGEIRDFPARFEWKSERGDDRYTLEIFTPALARIYRAEIVAESALAVPDSLGAILKPNIVYLWSVEGFKGLEPVAESPNGWFRVVRGSVIRQSIP